MDAKTERKIYLRSKVNRNAYEHSVAETTVKITRCSNSQIAKPNFYKKG
jgi:hypothetical protein